MLVDNNSEERKTREELKKFRRKNTHVPIKVILCASPFNFSLINNFAVRNIAEPCDYLWFLNNDTSFLSEKTLENYTGFASTEKEIGALGSTLLFGDKKTVQHSFLAPGMKIVGGHPLKGSLYKKNHSWFQKPRTVPAVTGASLFVSYENFCSLGMFDEQLAVSGQDLDFCLRLKERGLSNWTLTKEIIIHHESMSRNHYFDQEEITYFYKKWGKKLETFSELSTWNEEPSLKLLPLSYPWNLAMKIQNNIQN